MALPRSLRQDTESAVGSLAMICEQLLCHSSNTKGEKVKLVDKSLENDRKQKVPSSALDMAKKRRGHHRRQTSIDQKNRCPIGEILFRLVTKNEERRKCKQTRRYDQVVVVISFQSCAPPL